MAGDRPKFPDNGKPDRTTMEMGIVSYYDIGNSRFGVKTVRYAGEASGKKKALRVLGFRV